MSTDKLLPAPTGNEKPMLPGMDVIFKYANSDELFLEAWNAGGHPFNSLAIRERVQAAGKVLYEENGEPESSILHSSIHASGFALTINSLGVDIESARISPDRRGFKGIIHYGKFERISNPNLSLFRDAIGSGGGFGAENYMGIWHPSASIPNKILTAIYCYFLDKTLGKEHGYFFQKALDYSESVITANRHTFNSLVFKLTNSGRVSPEEAKEIFKSVRRIPFSLDGVPHE